MNKIKKKCYFRENILALCKVFKVSGNKVTAEHFLAKEFAICEIKWRRKTGNPVTGELNKLSKSAFKRIISNRVPGCRKWITEEGTFIDRNFSKCFDQSSFYSSYHSYFINSFGARSFFDTPTEQFTKQITNIRNSSKKMTKGEFSRFKSLAFYSSNERKLISYNINHIGDTNIILRKDGDEEVAKDETYYGTYVISNETLTMALSNNTIQITTIFLLTEENSIKENILLGITVGVSKYKNKPTLMSKKVMISVDENIKKKDNKRLKLFMNEHQGIRIKDVNCKQLKSIISDENSNITHKKILDKISVQMTDTMILLTDLQYVEVRPMDSFYVPLLSNYKLLESNIKRVRGGSHVRDRASMLNYKLQINILDCFLDITSDNKTFSNLRQKKSRKITMCIDYREDYQSFFNSSFDYERVLSSIKGNINEGDFELYLIFKKDDDYSTYLISIIPEWVKKSVYISYYGNHKTPDILAYRITVFVKIGKLLLLRPQGSSSTYTEITKARSSLSSVDKTIGVLMDLSKEKNVDCS